MTAKREALFYSAGLVLALAIVALAGRSRIFSWIAAGSLALHYAIALSFSRNAVDLAAPAMAVTWLVLLELIDLRHLFFTGGYIEPEVVGHRVRFLMLTSTIGGAIAAVVLFAGAIVETRSPAFVLVAAILVAGILMAPVYLAGAVATEARTP
jgi:hypothetical protein